MKGEVDLDLDLDYNQITSIAANATVTRKTTRATPKKGKVEKKKEAASPKKSKTKKFINKPVPLSKRAKHGECRSIGDSVFDPDLDLDLKLYFCYSCCSWKS